MKNQSMPITRILLLIGLVLFAFAASAILAIRAQPYDDSELRAFFARPDGCPMPCWQGIRPGVTSAEEAIAILEAHPWVQRLKFVHADTEAAALVAVTWQWSQRQPGFVSANRIGQIALGDGVVTAISFDTDFSLVQLALLLGFPSDNQGVYRFAGLPALPAGSASSTPVGPFQGSIIRSRPTIWYQGAIPDANLSLLGVMPCPPDDFDFWHIPMRITLRADAAGWESDPALPNLRSIAQNCLTPEVVIGLT